MIDPEHGWRAAFLIGAVLALIVFFMRLWLPESPRWLMTHGRAREAEEIVAGIEARLRAEGHAIPRRAAAEGAAAKPQPHAARRCVRTRCCIVHRQRTLVGARADGRAGVFLQRDLLHLRAGADHILRHPAEHVGWYILPFAVGNLLGPMLLGRLFDTIGRRPMIAFTYLMSGLLLALTGWLFAQGVLSASSRPLAWTVIFFFASAAASSAYLTVSETFPLEIRALAIALFYAVGTGIGGVAGPCCSAR